MRRMTCGLYESVHNWREAARALEVCVREREEKREEKSKDKKRMRGGGERREKEKVKEKKRKTDKRGRVGY